MRITGGQLRDVVDCIMRQEGMKISHLQYAEHPIMPPYSNLAICEYARPNKKDKEVSEGVTCAAFAACYKYKIFF